MVESELAAIDEKLLRENERVQSLPVRRLDLRVARSERASQTGAARQLVSTDNHVDTSRKIPPHCVPMRSDVRQLDWPVRRLDDASAARAG